MGPRVLIKDGRQGAWLFGRHFAPEVSAMIRHAAETCPPLTDDTMVIVEGWRDGPAGASLHSASKAIDIRAVDSLGRPGAICGKTQDDQIEAGRLWAHRLRQKLGNCYDVVFGDPRHINHLHVELDPKRRPYKPDPKTVK